MGYQIKTVSPDEARDMMKNGTYPEALVYLMSEVYLGDASGITVPWDELLEARFFSENGELHIFKCESEWKAVILSDDGAGDQEDTLDRTYQLSNKYAKPGRECITVRDYLKTDEDGQVYVEYTRLCRTEGGQTDVEEEE